MWKTKKKTKTKKKQKNALPVIVAPYLHIYIEHWNGEGNAGMLHMVGIARLN